METKNFKNIDITFKYDTYLSQDKTKKESKDYNILINGKFNHYHYDGDDIRNINFYNYYAKSSNGLSNELIKNEGIIKLPFSSNYITLNNLNYVVSSETEKKKLVLDDILKEPNNYDQLLDASFTSNIIQKFVNPMLYN